MKRILVPLVILGAVLAVVAASASARSEKTKAGPIVALLWPENVTPRWEGNDKPIVTAQLKKLIPGVQVDSLNALNKPTTQTSQAEAELAKGAKVLIVASIDGKAFAAVAKKAHAQGVKVIAYDRLINGPMDAYPSFNSVTVGQVEAGWMAKPHEEGRPARDHQRRDDRREWPLREHRASTRCSTRCSSRARGSRWRSSGRPAGIRRPRSVRRSRSSPSRTTTSRASSRRTTAWPAASSPPSRRRASRARCRRPARTRRSRVSRT